MTEYLLSWRVYPPPTGPYGSFESRPWPMAYLNDIHQTPMFMAVHPSSYSPKLSKKAYPLIRLHYADHSSGSFRWRDCGEAYASTSMSGIRANSRLFLSRNSPFIFGALKNKLYFLEMLYSGFDWPYYAVRYAFGPPGWKGEVVAHFDNPHLAFSRPFYRQNTPIEGGKLVLLGPNMRHVEVTSLQDGLNKALRHAQELFPR